jgi:superfamily II DNA or RNA helicase
LSGATWVGVRKLKKGKKNDGSPCNYFIDFVLSTDGDVDYSDEVFGEEISLTPEQEAQRDERRKQIEEIKRQRAKARRAKQRKRPKSAKQPVSAPKKQDAEREKQLVKALELLRKDFDDGIFTKAEYKKERAKLISKFEEGGEIL